MAGLTILLQTFTYGNTAAQAQRYGRKLLVQRTTMVGTEVIEAVIIIDFEIILTARLFPVCVDYNDNVYVVGYVGAAMDSQVHNGGYQDIALMRYNTSGSKIWTKLVGSTLSEIGNAGEHQAALSTFVPSYCVFPPNDTLF